MAIHVGATGYYNGNPYPSLAMQLAVEAKEYYSSLSPDERERREKKRKEDEEQKRVTYFIQQGKCPYCGTKLHRGKKDRKNDNKRIWSCFKCEKVFWN